jgi:hypothetical protein
MPLARPMAVTMMAAGTALVFVGMMVAVPVLVAPSWRGMLPQPRHVHRLR